MKKQKLITIYCKNNSSNKKYELGTSLKDIAEDMNIKLSSPTIAAYVNNELKELSYEIYRPKLVEFIDIAKADGMRLYIRSLSFVLYSAVKELFPNNLLTIEHSISNGLYCEVGDDEFVITDEIVDSLKKKMQELINKDIPFIKEEILSEEAIEIFNQDGLFCKAELLRARGKLFTKVYYLNKDINYFYGHLVPSPAFLKQFDIVKYYDGILLRIPKRDKINELERIIDQGKMFEIFREHKNWTKILNLSNAASLNNSIKQKPVSTEIIKISEAFHEKKIAYLADLVHSKIDDIRMILIAGPSSSGKTTFSKRLAVQLRVLGLKPVNISLDNYFVNREKTPLDENGEYDFETIDALDLELFNKHLLALLAGEEIQVPKFNFEIGQMEFNDDRKIKISDENIIIIEGIHGLNPKLTSKIEKRLKFKIYISALTQLSIDGHNRIPTTDNRLIRRIVRDHKYRNYSASDTISRWASVRRGEDKNIFPFQEEADVMFNSALLYELGVLKSFAEPILEAITQDQSEYSEAKRLLKFLSYFKKISPRDIPPTSLMREFLGGSSFSY